jgi:hypothetical protein
MVVMGVSATNMTERASRQENWIVWNAKLDHLVSPKAPTVSGQQHKLWVPEGVSSVDGSGAIKIR